MSTTNSHEHCIIEHKAVIERSSEHKFFVNVLHCILRKVIGRKLEPFRHAISLIIFGYLLKQFDFKNVFGDYFDSKFQSVKF